MSQQICLLEPGNRWRHAPGDESIWPGAARACLLESGETRDPAAFKLNADRNTRACWKACCCEMVCQ